MLPSVRSLPYQGKVKEVTTSRGRRRLGVDEVCSSEVGRSSAFMEPRFFTSLTQNRSLPARPGLDGPRGDLNPCFRGIHVPKDEEFAIREGSSGCHCLPWRGERNHLVLKRSVEPDQRGCVWELPPGQTRQIRRSK